MGFSCWFVSVGWGSFTEIKSLPQASRLPKQPELNTVLRSHKRTRQQGRSLSLTSSEGYQYPAGLRCSRRRAACPVPYVSQVRDLPSRAAATRLGQGSRGKRPARTFESSWYLRSGMIGCFHRTLAQRSAGGGVMGAVSSRPSS